MIRSSSLLVLCLCSGDHHAGAAVYAPVPADGGLIAVPRLPGGLSDAPPERLSLEEAPPGARPSESGVVDGRSEWRSRPRRAAPPTPGAARPAESPPETPAGTKAGGAAGPVAQPGEIATRRENAPPELGRIGPQRLVVGRHWQLHVRVRDADGDEPVFFTVGLPDSATFRRGRNGWVVLGWTPPPGAAGDELDVTIGAADGRDPGLRTERIVRLHVESGASGPPSAAPLGPAPALPLSAPRIEPLAAQIVSIGRTVSFRVAAHLDDGQRPQLQIDRLPRRAGFYENADGSRTFHWPTTRNDQGEHLFGITAVHPDDESLTSQTEMLVVVGDPTLARTEPVEPAARRGFAAPEPVDGSDGAVAYAPAYDTPSEDSYRDEPYEDEAYEDEAYEDEAYWDEAHEDDGFSFRDDDPDESGFYDDEDDPFGDARDPDEFDYFDEEPGSAHPDDGREYFLDADGIAVDAHGNPIGEFRLDDVR